MHRLTLRVVLSGVAFFTACGGGGTTTPSVVVASVTLDQTTASLTAPQTVTLVATPKDASGAALTGRTVTWSTDADAVASVSNAGVVTAKSAGTAHITATSESKTATATITVNPGLLIGSAGGTLTTANGGASVTIPAGALNSGTAITISAVTNPTADPKLIAGTAYDFGPTGTTFSTPATLNIKYDVTAEAGRTPSLFRIHKLVSGVWTLVPNGSVNMTTRTVTVPTSSFSTYAILETTVPIVPVASISVTPSPFELPNGMQLQLTAVTKDAQGNTLTGRTLAWSTLASNISVSNSGLVSTTAPGTATVTVLSEGITGTATINVRSDPMQRTLSLSPGGRFTNIPGSGLLGVPSFGESACAIGTDNRVRCWGDNRFGQLGDGTTLDRGSPVEVPLLAVTDVAVGTLFSCALDVNAAAWCWGSNASGTFGTGSLNTLPVTTRIRAGGAKSFLDIGAGNSHACGIDLSGTAWCWGDNAGGVLGNGTTTNTVSPSPVQVQNAPALVSLSVGSAGACGLTSVGALWCWGAFRDFTPAASAASVGGGILFSRVSVGGNHTCAIAMDRQLYCMGSNFSGQLGDGSTTTRVNPTLVAGGLTWRSVSASWDHTCGITVDYRTYCWGSNFQGNLGNGLSAQSNIPVQVSGAPPGFVAISAGNVATCGLTPDGLLYCWGERGVLANGEMHYVTTPVKVSNASNAIDVARGSPAGCYINNAQALQCWAQSEELTSAQTPNFGAFAAKSVVAGANFFCAIANSNSRVNCWGTNSFGQLGTGNTTSSTVPVPINSVASFTSIATGYYGGCGVTTAQALLCWGSTVNGSGTVTTPTQVQAATLFASTWGGGNGDVCGISTTGAAYCGPLPTSLTLVPGGITWSMMASGNGDGFNHFTCGLSTLGDAYCMGYNQNGQLGDGTTTNRATMALVSGGRKYSQIVAGGHFACGLVVTVATVYCWGDGFSDIGNGSAGMTTVPIQVPGGQQFTKLSASVDGVCGIVLDGSVYCWGYRYTSSLGNGVRDDVLVPTLTGNGLHFQVYELGSAGRIAGRPR